MVELAEIFRRYGPEYIDRFGKKMLPSHHRAMCEIAGHEGPLNRCTIYGSEEAGRRLNEMLEMGMSRPWPDALEALTGEREADATAIRDYFAPLQTWLDEQNAGRSCGW